MPGGTGKSGSRGATRRRSKAHVGRQLGGPLDHPGPAGEAPALLGPAPQVGGGRGGQPAVESSRVRRARTAARRWPAGAGPGWRSGRCWWPPGPRPGSTASSARASLRAESSGSPWSHSSTATWSRPNGRSAGRAPGPRRAGPSAVRAGGQGPLAAPGQDQPVPAVPVGQRVEGDDRACPSPRRPAGPRRWPGSGGRSPRGRGPAPPGGCRPGRARRCAARAGRRSGDRVSSAPNTVGSPKARAASAKRTTP